MHRKANSKALRNAHTTTTIHDYRTHKHFTIRTRYAKLYNTRFVYGLCWCLLAALICTVWPTHRHTRWRTFLRAYTLVSAFTFRWPPPQTYIRCEYACLFSGYRQRVYAGGWGRSGKTDCTQHAPTFAPKHILSTACALLFCLSAQQPDCAVDIFQAAYANCILKLRTTNVDDDHVTCSARCFQHLHVYSHSRHILYVRLQSVFVCVCVHCAAYLVYDQLVFLEVCACA